jgi:hypothetical protein
VGVGRGTEATAGVDVLTVVAPGTRSTTEGAFVGGEDDGPAAVAVGILILIFAFEGFWYLAIAKAGGRSDMSWRNLVYDAG